MKKRTCLLACCILLVSALFLSPGITLASTWVITFDGGDPLFYTVIEESITSGGNTGNCVDGGAHVERTNAQVEVDLGANYTVTNTKLDWKKVTDPTGNMTRAVRFYNSSHTQITSITVSNVQTTGVWRTENFGSINVANVRYMVFSVGASQSPLTLHSQMDNLEITTGASGTPTATLTPTNTPNPSLGGWNKPLKGIDQKFDDVSFHPGRSFLNMAGIAFKPGDAPFYLGYNFNLGFSNSPNSNVFAVQAGSIDSVIVVPECVLMDLGAPDKTCQFYWDVQPSGTAYYLRLSSAYLITESLANGRIVRYIVESPNVQSGDTVTAGCLIGKAIPVIGWGGGELGYGVVIVQGLESDAITAFDISSFLVNEPSGSACHVSTTSPCALVNNANFSSTQGWQANPSFPDLPLSISPFGLGMTFPGSAQQTLNLDSAQQYKITIHYSVLEDSPPQSIIMQLGTTIGSIPLDPGQHNERSTDSQLWTPDQDSGLYTLGIYAQPGAADRTTLELVCVYETGTAPPSPAGGCIVLDPYFNQSFTSSPWTASASPLAIIPGGMAVVPDGGSISQSITLNPADGGGNFNYDLKITYRRQGIANPGDDIRLDWEFGAQSGSLTPAKADQVWSDYTDTFGVATDPVTDDLIITGVGSDSLQAAQISKICIVAHDGGNPPGYQPPVPFTGGCRFCVYSATGDVATDISEFQQWLACQFYQLWECQAKILLRYIWQTLVSILTLLGFFRLWLSSVIIGLVTWGNGNLLVFARYLEGLINNLGITIQNALVSVRSFTLINSAGAGFWDAIVSIANALRDMVTGLINGIGTPIIALLQQIVTGLFGVLGAVMGIIGTVLGIVFNWLTVQASILLSLLRNVIGALFLAFNSASVAIPPGAPDCSVPGAVLYYPCLGFYVLDNTIFSGPVMYIIPLFMGITAWRVLLWSANKVKGVFE